VRFSHLAAGGKFTTADLDHPRGDRLLREEQRCQLDRLYQRMGDDRDALRRAVGRKVAA